MTTGANTPTLRPSAWVERSDTHHVQERWVSRKGSTHPTNYELPRCEREVICPSGSLLTGLSSLISVFPKDISVPNYPKSILELSPSRPTEGRFAIVTNVGHGMRWTRQRQARNVMAGRVGERPVSDQTAS